MFTRIKNFLMEVTTELKKVSWSTRRELFDATWLVLTSSAILGIFIGLTDFVLSRLVGFIIR